MSGISQPNDLELTPKHASTEPILPSVPSDELENPAREGDSPTRWKGNSFSVEKLLKNQRRRLTKNSKSKSRSAKQTKKSKKGEETNFVDPPAPSYIPLPPIGAESEPINSPSKITVEKAISLEDLIIQLTAPSTPNALLNDFLLTYRSICDSESFLEALVKRCNDAEDNLVHIRCFALLRTWVDKHEHDFSKDKDSLYAILKKWENDSQDSPSLFSMINKLLIRVENPVQQTTFVTRTTAPMSILPTGGMTAMQFEDVHCLELARQITLMEEAMWINIEPWECLGQTWQKKDLKDTQAPNIVKFISWFNNINVWVRTEILTEISLKRRAKILQKFMEICLELVQLQNFNGALEIVSALNSTSILRLRRTFNLISRQVLSDFEKIKNQLSADTNFKSLRAFLHTLSPPCIPYLGMYLTDLTFIEDANPDITQDGYINFGKRIQIAATIKEIQRYQISKYQLRPVFEVQHIFENGPRINNDDQLYLFSKFIEPPGGGEPVEEDMPIELRQFIYKVKKRRITRSADKRKAKSLSTSKSTPLLDSDRVCRNNV